MAIKRSILYFADIHGPELIKQRSIHRNFSGAGTTKVISICQAMKAKGHRVVVYSLGSPAERNGRYYQSMKERIGESNGDGFEITYSASVDNRLLRGVVGVISATAQLPKIVAQNSVDTIVIYNLTFFSVLLALAAFLFGKVIILDYEDSARVGRETPNRWFRNIYYIYEYLIGVVGTGVIGASQELVSAIQIDNKLWVPGILGDDLLHKAKQYLKDPWTSDRPLRLIYAGGLDRSKGIDKFLKALNGIDYSLEMVVCGSGNLHDEISEICINSKHVIKFHGLVSRDKLIDLMLWADVGINPHLANLHDGGSWPFKVIEYLGTCGTVFCNDTNILPLDLKDKLFLYMGNEVNEIQEQFSAFCLTWPKHSVESIRRMCWAQNNYGLGSIGEKIELFLEKSENN